MTRRSRLDWLILTCVVSTILGLGCAGGPAEDPGSTAATAAGGGEATSAAAPAGDSMPPLPDPPTAEGELSRSYAGLTLGDPPPAAGERLDDPPPIYPDATQYMIRAGESPRVRVAAYVHEGTIFYISWRVRDAALEREAVVAAFAERLGQPEDSKWLPEHVTNWNDGLSVGTTSLSVVRQPGSDWLHVQLEDTGRAADLMQLGGRG